MHLKRLEIVGFKSFSDPVRLDLEPGITAVVGPNGCGKSNIMDAMRWCLGEMSAKSLRSNLMLDVVFNGSGSRPPQNMAEVTLTFDNTDKRLPIDYSDVSITRRLFRSGESEYYINKTQCRLRDIKELFLDTGMGEDGYSCMEQGKVEWILQAKPEERRELFEEAAGVSKYRARREEALRKMEKVEVDLSRIADIISVTNDQIKKLENAVNKAKTYQRLREELKTMEVNEWLFQLTQGDQELAAIQGRLENDQRSTEDLNTKVHQFDADIAALRLSLTQTEEQLLQANGILAGIDADIKIGEERLAGSRRRQEELEKQWRAVQESLEREQVRVKELKQQEAVHLQAFEQLKSESEKIEAEYVEAQRIHDTALQNLEAKKKEVKEGRDLILDRAQERLNLQRQIAHLSSDVTRLLSRSENVQKEKERNAKQLEEARRLSQSINDQKAGFQDLVTSKSGDLEEKAKKAEQLAVEIRETQARLLNYAEDIAKLNGQIHSIRDQQMSDPYLAGTNAALSSGLPGVYGPLGRLFKCAESDLDLISSTLGEHLGDLVAETAEDARRVIDYLQTEGKGRARIWILNQLPQTSGSQPLATISSSDPLANRLQCEEKFKPLLSYLCSSLWVQGGTVYGLAMINGGIDPSKWKSHVLHRLPELEALRQQKELEKTTLESSFAALTSEREKANSDKESVLRELQELRVRLELVEKEAAKISKEIDVYREEQQVIEMEWAQCQEEKIKAQVQLEESQGRFQVLHDREKEDHDQLDLLQQELTDLQHAYAHTNAQLANKSEGHKSFKEKMDWQMSVLNQIQKDLSSLAESARRADESTSLIKAEIESAREAQAAAQNLVESSIAKRDVAATECSGYQARRVELAEKIQAAESSLSKMRDDLAQFQQSYQNELIQQTMVKNKCDSLLQKLQDQYEMTLETAKAQGTPAMADPETLERLKKRVANMGPINLAAPQEHAELSEKNNFLITQQTDLLKAKEDLRQVITKINSTTRDHFRETFEKVRENFRRLYSQLFQGGEADLRFTDEADILNTGIDIYCQPPGKKLLHISLLSGGEKALTAIALLFAFFQVRPSPIALMDEVDAPLDEANVLRYVDMIKLFSEKSQFILISHNKRTMEAANTLYGVTMEEFGVSKVLSARLQKEAPVATAPTSAETVAS